MSRNYKFHNPVGVYFVSFAVVEWIDVFTRNEYKDMLPLLPRESFAWQPELDFYRLEEETKKEGF